MASPDTKAAEETATGDFGDANGPAKHTSTAVVKEETDVEKGGNIPADDLDEKIPEEDTIDKQVILSPTRRIRTTTLASHIYSMLTRVRARNKDRGNLQSVYSGRLMR
jgi:hypothetical protein